MRIDQGVFVTNASVFGKIRFFDRHEPQIKETSSLSASLLWERFTKAKTRLMSILEAEAEDDLLKDQETKAIFNSQRAILDDQLFSSKVKEAIASGKSLIKALKEAEAFLLITIDGAVSDYIRERRYDIIDVIGRLIRDLGDDPKRDNLKLGEFIYAAERFLPSEVIDLVKGGAKGFLCRADSSFSHSAILAQSLKVPYVVQIKDDFNNLTDEDEILIDGFHKVLNINPDQSQIHQVIDQPIKMPDPREQASLLRSNGTEIRLTLSSQMEIENLDPERKENIGLIRSEFLFLEEDVRLDLNEQLSTYESIMNALKGREVVIRTFDYRGEKQSSGNTKTHVDADLALKIQLEALFLASRKGRLKILFPLVGDSLHAEKYLRIARNVKAELAIEGTVNLEGVLLGAMVETKNAIAKLGAIAPLFSFIAIGTNDLFESISDQRRDHLVKEPLEGPLARELKALIMQATKTCKRLQIPIGVCGFFAEDDNNFEFLREAEVDYVSVSLETLKNVYHI